MRTRRRVMRAAACCLTVMLAAGCVAIPGTFPFAANDDPEGRAALEVPHAGEASGAGRVRLASNVSDEQFDRDTNDNRKRFPFPSASSDRPVLDSPARSTAELRRRALAAEPDTRTPARTIGRAGDILQTKSEAETKSAAIEPGAPVPPPPAPPREGSLGKSSEIAPGPPPLRAEDSEPVPIDLETALDIASGRNPDVVFAHARIREAMAQETRALTLWLPSIRGGLNYNKHEGRIQDVRGTLFDTSRNAFFSGLGANAVGAASPTIPGVAMNFHLADALLQPHIAEHEVAARNQASRAITNDTLLQTALAYNELLRAAQERAVALDTLERAESLAELTGQYARTGQGLESDYDRARTELALRRNERQRADEGVAVASARLAQLLRLDPARTLLPQEAVITPINLVACDRPLPELVAEGLQRRPELAENRQLVAEAVARLRREQFAPLVPSVLVGMSYGTFGGGLANNLIHYGDRIDTDAIAYWEVRNLGFGDYAARKEAQSRIDQARQRCLATMDRVAREVVEAATQVESRRRQIDTGREGVETAISSYEKNLDRIRNAQGLPIEVLQSLQALNTARREYLRAIADYNAAQFQLHRALGCPTRPE